MQNLTQQEREAWAACEGVSRNVNRHGELSKSDPWVRFCDEHGSIDVYIDTRRRTNAQQIANFVHKSFDALPAALAAISELRGLLGEICGGNVFLGHSRECQRTPGRTCMCSFKDLKARIDAALAGVTDNGGEDAGEAR